MLFSTRYFEDDEEESSSNVDLPYIPAENSPTRQQMQSGGGSDSEDDPLDAFMAEVEVRMKLQSGRNKPEYDSKRLICCFLSHIFLLQSQAAKDMRKLEEKEKEKKSAK